MCMVTRGHFITVKIFPGATGSKVKGTAHCPFVPSSLAPPMLLNKRTCSVEIATQTEQVWVEKMHNTSVNLPA